MALKWNCIENGKEGGSLFGLTRPSFLYFRPDGESDVIFLHNTLKFPLLLQPSPPFLILILNIQPIIA